MNKLKKAMAIFVSFVLLAAVCIAPVYALGGLLGSSITDLLGGLLNGNAGNNENEPLLFSTLLQNPGGILDALRERLADYDLGDVSNTDLVNALSQLLNGDTKQIIVSGKHSVKRLVYCFVRPKHHLQRAEIRLRPQQGIHHVHQRFVEYKDFHPHVA